MQYIEMVEAGGPEVMRLNETAPPQPSPGELLIRVRAAGVNRPDVLQRQGRYAPPPGSSPILGLEVAGEVEQVADGAGPWCEGDRVCALTNGGGYAEHVAVPATQCLPFPSGLNWAQAAALPETCFTVWGNVFVRGRLSAGESLLVHGGGSGIGTTAIQLARVHGATVFATAGSSAKCTACLELGAELAINYREQDYVDAILTATDGRGVDVILDMVGGDYVQRNFKVAAVEGRIVQIAFLRGAQVDLNLGPLMMKRLTFTGSTLRAQSTAAKAELARGLLEHVWPHVASGAVHPVISGTYPLSQVAEAHRVLESNAQIGKLVLMVGEPS